jgi:branched-chain amino acid transport system permease protein
MKFLSDKLTAGNTLIVVVIVVLALLPIIGAPKEWVLYIFTFLIYLAMANMWNLLAGYSGLLSLCQPAFIGLAGYSVALVTWVGIPWWVGLIGGAAIGAAFALLISYPVFRLSGIYFAIGTLVVPEALRILFYLWKPVGGPLQGRGAGYMIKDIGNVTMSEMYWMALVVAIVSAIVLRIILRSKLGLGLAAIRDNQRTASSSGVSIFWIKVYPFMISAAITALAGGVFYLYQGYIEPSNSFNIKWTLIMLLATVIGGMRSEGGPIIGAIIMVILNFALAKFSSYSMLIQGVLLVIMMLLSPQGIVGLVRDTKAYKVMVQSAAKRLFNPKAV